jgi:uncharacterized protein YcbK (DUF882 family)
MTIRQAEYWRTIVKTASRVYEAERELFTHCLTLIVLVGLIGSAAYMDTRLQPRAARAEAVKKTAASSTQAPNSTPPQQEAATPAPDPALPPALTQGTQNLNPELIQRFDAFRTFIFTKYHVVVEVKSGYRSYEEQAQLYATLPAGRANPPGKSNHEKGEAIDYTNYTPEYNQYLGQFGLHAPYAGKEDWHIERVEMPPAS